MSADLVVDENLVEGAEAALAEVRDALQTLPEVAVSEVEAELESPWLADAIEKQKKQLVQVTPVISLLLKLDAWLLQQPEFLAVLQAPRATRRQAIKLIAKHIATFPARGKTFGGFNPED